MTLPTTHGERAAHEEIITNPAHEHGVFNTLIDAVLFIAQETRKKALIAGISEPDQKSIADELVTKYNYQHLDVNEIIDELGLPPNAGNKALVVTGRFDQNSDPSEKEYRSIAAQGIIKAELDSQKIKAIIWLFVDDIPPEWFWAKTPASLYNSKIHHNENVWRINKLSDGKYQAIKMKMTSEVFA